MDEFSLKPHLKEKVLNQLYSLIVCVEDGIKPHVEQILTRVVYKNILDEEAGIANRVLKITELLGLYVPMDFILPKIIAHLTDSESKSVPLFVSSCLTAFSAVITYSSIRFADQFENNVDSLLALIVKSDYLQSENADVLARTLKVTHNIVFAGGKESCKNRQHVLFKILLQLGSCPTIEDLRPQVDETLQLLAKNCSLEDASDLFSIELASLLDEMKEDYENWSRNTPERFIFDMLVRRSQTAVVDYWESILEIIATNTDHGKDYELRVDMLSLIEHFLLEESLHSTIVFYSEIIVKLILLPATEWRVGAPNVKIRKAAIICLIKLTETKLIDPAKLKDYFSEICKKMSSCLDDDWGNDLRFAAVVFLRKLLVFLTNTADNEDLKTIYPELLKRLDDAQDGIRVETCKALEVMFDMMADPWSSSLYEYTVKAIFIHLDDPNEEVQKATTKVLQKAARV